MTKSETSKGTDLSPVEAWSQRVKRVGGFIQLAFAAFWLVRGAFNLHGQSRGPLSLAFVVVTLIVVVYGDPGHGWYGPEADQSRSETHRAIRDHRDRHRADRSVHPPRDRHRCRPQRLGAPFHCDHHRAATAVARPPRAHPPVPRRRLGYSR